jgi:hypothetical protein
MPYKRLSRLGWTFSIPKSVAVFSESDFFNTHSQYGVTGADAPTVG